jgi:hypothetical protein
MTVAVETFPTDVDASIAAMELQFAVDEVCTDPAPAYSVRDVLGRTAVWISADEVPDLRVARQAADEKAAQIYEGYMTHVREGDVSEVPLDADAISEADRVVVVRQHHGVNSVEYREAYEGLLVNNRRYLAETWSKNEPEYFARLEQVYDPKLRDYTFHGQPVTPMVQRGITPLAETDEVPRRVMENRENATNNRLGELVMRASGVKLVDASVPSVALPLELRRGLVSSQTISECPDYIEERYIRDVAAGRKRSYGGYAPQIKKLMLRSTQFDPTTGNRYVEQLAISGESAIHAAIVAYLEGKGVIPEGSQPGKTEVLGLQVLTNSQEGVVGMAREIDAVAGRLTGKNIFLGREVPADHPKDYAAIPVEAAARQAKQEADAIALTEYTLDLAESGVEHVIGNKMYDERVMDLMFATAKEDLEMAEAAFDKETADGLRSAQLARSRGDYEAAAAYEDQARELAPPPEGCSGGGACGIEELNMSSEVDRKLAKLLSSAPGEKIAKYTMGSCKNCSNRTVGYKWDSKQFTAACAACDKVVTKKSIVLAA